MKELIFKTKVNGDDIKVTLFEFNKDSDRFVITIGDDSNSCDEDAYRIRFLNNSEAKELADFLYENINLANQKKKLKIK